MNNGGLPYVRDVAPRIREADICGNLSPIEAICATQLERDA
jgi:hypothetical protein